MPAFTSPLAAKAAFLRKSLSLMRTGNSRGFKHNDKAFQTFVRHFNTVMKTSFPESYARRFPNSEFIKVTASQPPQPPQPPQQQLLGEEDMQTDDLQAEELQTAFNLVTDEDFVFHPATKSQEKQDLDKYFDLSTPHNSSLWSEARPELDVPDFLDVLSVGEFPFEGMNLDDSLPYLDIQAFHDEVAPLQQQQQQGANPFVSWSCGDQVQECIIGQPTEHSHFGDHMELDMFCC